MNRWLQTLQAFRAARGALAALAGGRAPRVFRRGFEGQVGAASGLRRGTAWLRELAAIRPSLRSGPLLGGALAELTGGEPGADAAASPGARRGAARAAESTAADRQGRPALSVPPTRRSSPTSREWGSAPPRAAAPVRSVRPAPPGATRRDPAAPLAFAERADRDLLERLSTPAGALPAVDPGRAAAPRSASFPVPVPGGTSRLARNAAAEALWRREMSRRAERAQRSGRAGGPERTSAAPARSGRPARGEVSGGRSGPASSLEAGSGERPLAADPWQLPLAGERAPREILDRLRAAGRDRSGAPASPARPDRSARSTLPALPASDTGADRASAPAGSSGAWPAPATAAPGVSTAGPDLAAGPLLVPPPSLPPFLQVHAATEVALRRPAAEGPSGPGIPPRAPALLPEDELAARIDRILAEEARRHGIDV